MTREEKQKAIDALKISAPIMAVTQEEFNDYIQTLNKVMDWLEQGSTTKNDLGVDCISRQDVLTEIIRFSTEEGASVECQQLYCDVNNIPSVTPQPRWIPVSERLPENDGFYLVTEKSGRVCTYVFHKEGNSEEYWERCTVAWMPLPQPYREVEE